MKGASELMARSTVWEIAWTFTVLVYTLIVGCSKSDRDDDIYQSVRSAGQLVGNQYANDMLDIEIDFPSGARIVHGADATDSTGGFGAVTARDDLFIAMDTVAGALVKGRLPRVYEGIS